MPEPEEIVEQLSPVELNLRDLVQVRDGYVLADPTYGDHPLATRYDQPVFPPPLAVRPLEEEVEQGDEEPSEEE